MAYVTFNQLLITGSPKQLFGTIREVQLVQFSKQHKFRWYFPDKFAIPWQFQVSRSFRLCGNPAKYDLLSSYVSAQWPISLSAVSDVDKLTIERCADFTH